MNVICHLDIVIISLVIVHQGILHPHIVSSHLITDALVPRSPSFPPDTSLPFTLSKDSAHLYRTCEVQIYIRDNVLGYVIVLTLVNKGTYCVLWIIPVPITTGQGNFTHINTDKVILCFDRARQYHFMIFITVSRGSYTGCNRRKGQNFGRVFLMLKYTDITQNTYIQS